MTPRTDPRRIGKVPGALDSNKEIDMFFFFSNRLGCLGSLLLSGAVTVLLLLALNR